MEAVIQGVTYVSQKPEREECCKGCVGDSSKAVGKVAKEEARRLCLAMPTCTGNGGVIFVRKLEAVSTSEAKPNPVVSVQYDAGYAKGMADGYTKGYDEAVAKYRGPVSITPSQAFARATDPSTSHQAAEAMTRKAGKIADLILVELGSGGLRPPTYGLTGKQLAQRTGVPLNSITPRFTQLVRKGLIYAYSGAGRETVWALGNGVAA